MSNLTGPWEGAPGNDPPRPTVQGRALALSGGGLRATLFHLGVVERLYELDALHKFTYLTSVSGGSILAGVLALAWTRLQQAADRAACFAQLVADPIVKLAKSDLRDRALRRAVLTLPWRRPIECLAEILDEELLGQATFANLPPPSQLRVGFNACNLDDGKRFLFTQDYFGDAATGYTVTACGAVPVATAVAASAAFPMGFAPFPVTLAGPFRRWREDGRFVDVAPQPKGPIPFGDGGIFENLGLLSARHRAREIFVVNGGEAIDTSIGFAHGNPAVTAMRSIVVMMSRNARQAISEFFDAQEYDCCTGVVVENTQVADVVARRSLPVASYDPDPPTPPPSPANDARFPPLPHGANGYPREVAIKLATLRTDLDAFSDVEIATLRYHGRSLCDVGLRRFQPAWIARDPGPIGAPDALTADELAALDRGRQHKFGDLFLRFWRT